MRTVDKCPYRFDVEQRADAEVARCGVVWQITGDQRTVPITRRGTCEYCCQLTEPSAQILNRVVASLTCEAAARIIAKGGVAGCGTAEATRIQRLAMRELEIVPDRADDTGASWRDSVTDTPQAFIDPSITVDTFTDHLARNEPFTYARFGDGEWLSMLGARGRNCDDHMYFPNTMGRELRQSLDELVELSLTGANTYVGLHAEWHQGDIQHYLRTHNLTESRCYVDCRLLQWGLRDLSTKRFLEAIRDFPGRKVLVASRQLRPVAKGLRCRHVVIANRDCYLNIHRTEKACRFHGTGLVLMCASMATECLIGRLLRRGADSNVPSPPPAQRESGGEGRVSGGFLSAARLKTNSLATLIDCGHIFDAMVFGPTRQYTVNDTDGISDILKTHYTPMFLERRPRWARPLVQWRDRGR